MGEYEPDDSRDVTLKPNNVPGEPTPTGAREDEARQKAKASKTQPAQQQQAQSMDDKGMSQSLGGMSQSMGKVEPNTARDVGKEEQPHAPGESRVKAETFEQKDVEVVDPAPWGAEASPPSEPEPNRESDTGIGGDTYDSYADTLSEQASGTGEAQRRQAAEQGDAGDVPATDDDDADAMAADNEGRGYGDSSDARLAALRGDKS
ncbi:hypothetical protein V5740_08060 [Croceibacterium sp. TMG7-5b_MA50]|uniref:hypothetical protein n=1 Tax=Croceibacterium sp. TMG7-5b_MA50 TaxID=3121290 RepID=UPI00322142FD